MTAPACNDPVSDVINYFVTALRSAYDPAGPCPPDGLTEIPLVQLFAGDGPPMASFDAHTNNPGCDVPFIWIRLANRYWSSEFPAPVTGSVNCALIEVAAIEVGVAWCALTTQYPTPDQYATQAEQSLDHSWRLSRAVCGATGKLRKDTHMTGLDTLSPYGPEGGVLGWTTTVFVSCL